MDFLNAGCSLRVSSTSSIFPLRLPSVTLSARPGRGPKASFCIDNAHFGRCVTSSHDTHLRSLTLTEWVRNVLHLIEAGVYTWYSDEALHAVDANLKEKVCGRYQCCACADNAQLGDAFYIPGTHRCDISLDVHVMCFLAAVDSWVGVHAQQKRDNFPTLEYTVTRIYPLCGFSDTHSTCQQKEKFCLRTGLRWTKLTWKPKTRVFCGKQTLMYFLCPII